MFRILRPQYPLPRIPVDFVKEFTMPNRAGRLMLVVAFGALLAACGGGQKETGFPGVGESPTPTTTATATSTATRTTGGGGGSRVEVVDSSFKPKEITVAVGAKVTWFQTGALPHTVTADDDSFNSSPDCSFSDQSKCLTTGKTFSFTFAKAGTFPYYCELHGNKGGFGMAGTVIVK
jgi:plastocyanin